MLILEGSDHLGKTTAAKGAVRLMNGRGDYPVRYQHMTRQAPSFNFASDYLDMMSLLAVQDRFHLGAIAYHEKVMPNECLRWLEGQILIRASVIVIFVCRNDLWYKERLQKSKGQMFDVDFMVEANRRYVEMVEKRLVHYDFAKYVNGPEDFPDESDIDLWIDVWLRRLNFLETVGEED